MANKVNYTATVTVGAVWVWSTPSMSGKKLGIVKKGQVLKVTQQDRWWIKHETGWSSTLESDGSTIIKVKTNTTTTTKPTPKKVEKPVDYDKYYYEYVNNSKQPTASAASQLFIKNVRGIYGLPYQYMPVADTRLSGSEFGRKYAERIVSRMPLLLLTPGKPKFMSGFSKEEKKSILQYAKSKNSDSTLDQLLNNEKGKFYSFEFAYKEYYKFVNSMCQMVARYLGIQNETIDGTKLDRYKWQNYANNSLKSFISNKDSVAFYLDSESSVTETFSNNTGESQLSSSVNSISDMSREIQFLLGGTAGKEFEMLKSENYDASIEEFDKFTSKYTSILPEKLVNNLKHGFMTVATGGKMLFPEIWNDSDFSRSYSISIKLRSPDADVLSLFMNIFVPIIHLIGLAAPQQLGPNGYKSPFLVRAYYKGFFNCDMGIITNMSINRGDKGKWTVNGLPTEVDINLDIKDLYQMMSINSSDKPLELMQNTILLDYLANMCGVNINKPDILRTIDIYYTQFTNKIINKATFDGFLGVDQWLSNMASKFYKK